ncbi:MAG: DUF1353 domain-containing protein [Pseudomonadota bacterium]
MSDTAGIPRKFLDTPYPDAGWQRVDGFEYLSDLHLSRLSDRARLPLPREAQYLLSRPYRCAFRVDGTRRELEVPAGMLTDLASVPAIARTFVGRVGRHLEAAIVHDFLFVAWQDLKQPYTPTDDDFHFANAVMTAAMDEAAVRSWRKVAIRVAVGSFIGRRVFFDANEDPRFVEIDHLRL